MVPMSFRCGTLVKVTGSRVSSAAQSSGSAAFLAPDMAISPDRGRRPRSAAYPLAFHSSGVSVCIDSACNSPESKRDLEDRIDALLALDAVQPGKLAADDHGREMMSVAVHGKMLAGQAGGNPGFDLFGVEHDVTPQARSL
jgi:hypothetical protein